MKKGPNMMEPKCDVRKVRKPGLTRVCFVEDGRNICKITTILDYCQGTVLGAKDEDPRREERCSLGRSPAGGGDRAASKAERRRRCRRALEEDGNGASGGHFAAL